MTVGTNPLWGEVENLNRQIGIYDKLWSRIKIRNPDFDPSIDSYGGCCYKCCITELCEQLPNCLAVLYLMSDLEQKKHKLVYEICSK